MKPLAAMITAILLSLTGGCLPSHASEAYQPTGSDKAFIDAYGHLVTPGRNLVHCKPSGCYDVLTGRPFVSDNLQGVEGYLLTEVMDDGDNEVR